MDDALAAAGASLIPSAALAGGALSGKYAGDAAAGRLSDELGDPRRAAALQLGAALRGPAAALGTTPATLAIAFTLLHPRTAATLIGATAPAQIDAALDAVELAGRLTPDDVAKLRRLAGSGLSAGVPSFLLLSREVRGSGEERGSFCTSGCTQQSIISLDGPPTSRGRSRRGQ
jgi:hypothetical protein